MHPLHSLKTSHTANRYPGVTGLGFGLGIIRPTAVLPAIGMYASPRMGYARKPFEAAVWVGSGAKESGACNEEKTPPVLPRR